jgi:hypothetical protein
MVRWCFKHAALLARNDRNSYNNIVYITESDKTTAVTCYAKEQRRRVQSGETPITSHSVLVVDQSASMNRSDVMGHRSRSRGMFYTIANEMIAEPLLRGLMSYTDVVTIIEMRTDAIVHDAICLEPYSWELHNKLVHLASLEEAMRGAGHGNYIPAIRRAFDVLSAHDQKGESMALNLFFLSDGRPSEMSSLGVDPSVAMDYVAGMCHLYGDRLTVGTFGFAHDDGKGPFSLLERMAATARNHGAKGLHAAGLDSTQLRQALSMMTSSLVTSRTAMSSLAGGSLLRVRGDTQPKPRRVDLKRAAGGASPDCTRPSARCNATST